MPTTLEAPATVVLVRRDQAFEAIHELLSPSLALLSS
jgi:hypothetical protein